MGEIRYTRPRSVGEALQILRGRSHLSRDEVAERAQVAAGTLSRYEAGSTGRPDASVLRRLVTVLADALGYPADEVWAELGEILDEQGRDVEGRMLDQVAGTFKDEES